LSFSKVLREVIEQDDGVVLRLASVERMIASHGPSGGNSAGLRARIQERSRTIAAWVGAFLASARTRRG